jgi:hypothetical protein
MKAIQPISLWDEGQMIQATKINCIGQDDFNTSLGIYYQLFSDSNRLVGDGNLTINNVDYTSYNTSSNNIDYVYTWVTTKLGLTLA